MIYKTPTLDELTEKVENTNQQVKDDMERAIKDLNLLQKDIDEMSRQMLEKMH